VVECGDKEGKGLKLQKVDPELGKRRAGELARYKATRDSAGLGAAISELKTAAEGSANLTEPIVAAVRAGATVGEVSDTLRDVFGEYDRRK